MEAYQRKESAMHFPIPSIIIILIIIIIPSSIIIPSIIIIPIVVPTSVSHEVSTHTHSLICSDSHL